MSGSARRRLAALAAGVLAAGGALCVASPASAIASPVLVEASSALNANNFKNATATCAVGQRVYGAAFVVVDGLGRVAVNTAQPSSNLSSVLVEAMEVAPVSTSWRVIAQAICGPPVAGLQRVSATTSDAAIPSKTVKASCPSSQKPYGAGFVFTNGYAEAFLNQMVVTMGSGSVTSGVTVRGDLDDTLLNWSATAYAICGAPSPNQAVITSSNYVFDSATPKDASASCPSGTRLHGVGLIRTGAETDVLTEDVGAGPSSASGKAYENDSTSASWAVIPQAVCAS
ncbi:hypothetical protein [Phytohabitans houttuyneae]|nr:hypothetical protein [Phytohabitans houttuyneae]